MAARADLALVEVGKLGTSADGALSRKRPSGFLVSECVAFATLSGRDGRELFDKSAHLIEQHHAVKAKGDTRLRPEDGNEYQGVRLGREGIRRGNPARDLA